jgi:hypothetical protein
VSTTIRIDASGVVRDALDPEPDAARAMNGRL